MEDLPARSVANDMSRVQANAKLAQAIATAIAKGKGHIEVKKLSYYQMKHLADLGYALKKPDAYRDWIVSWE